MEAPNVVARSGGGGSSACAGENRIMGALSREIGGAEIDEEIELGIVARRR